MYQPPHKQTDKSGENDKFPPVAMYGDTPLASFQKVRGVSDKLYGKGAANYISRDNLALFVYPKKHQESNDQVVPSGTNAIGVDGLRPSYNLSKFCRLERSGWNGDVWALSNHSYLTLIKKLPMIIRVITGRRLACHQLEAADFRSIVFNFNQSLTNGCQWHFPCCTVVGVCSSPHFNVFQPISTDRGLQPASWPSATSSFIQLHESCHPDCSCKRYNKYMNRRSELQIILPHSSPLVSTLGADHSDRPCSKATVSPARSQGRDLERLRPTKLRSGYSPATPTCKGRVSLFVRSSAFSRADQHTCQPKLSRKRANALGRQADGKCVYDSAFSSRLITQGMQLREIVFDIDSRQEAGRFGA